MSVAFPTRIRKELHNCLPSFFSHEFLKNIDETSSDNKNYPIYQFFPFKKADDWKISLKDWKSNSQQLIIENLPVMKR